MAAEFSRLVIRNRIEAVKVYDKRQTRQVDLENLLYCVNHRIDLGADAVEIAKNFCEIPEAAKVTGKQMPYHLVVLKDGTIEQALELGDFGPHALAYNAKSIAVAWIGDFRKYEPTPEQWASGILLNGLFHGWGLVLSGHTELKMGTADPSKQCPGKFFNLHKLRIDARLTLPPRGFVAEKQLLSLGVVF